MLRGSQVSCSVRKTLIFSTAVLSGLKKKYRESKSMKEKKKVITKLVHGCTRKYRMLQCARSFVGVPRKPMADQGKLTDYMRKPSCNLATRLRKKMAAFFQCDDNSRITTGKKDTLAKQKVKKQRYGEFFAIPWNGCTPSTVPRLLTMPSATVYSVRSVRSTSSPQQTETQRERETCLYRTHENARLLAQRLSHLKLLENANSVEDIVVAAVCAQPSEECYNRDCPNCRDSLLDVKTSP